MSLALIRLEPRAGVSGGRLYIRAVHNYFTLISHFLLSLLSLPFYTMFSDHPLLSVYLLFSLLFWLPLLLVSIFFFTRIPPLLLHPSTFRFLSSSILLFLLLPPSSSLSSSPPPNLPPLLLSPFLLPESKLRIDVKRECK